MSARVLIAGVGNVFLSDDGFGVAVAQLLARAALPEGVVVRDVGVRGLHLAYELLDPPELLVVVDLVSRGEKPGTLYVIEPILELGRDASPHGMDLHAVAEMVRALGGTMPRVIVVGCEPADLDEGMELSGPVRAAIEPAAALVLRSIHEMLAGEMPAHEEELR